MGANCSRIDYLHVRRVPVMERMGTKTKPKGNYQVKDFIVGDIYINDSDEGKSIIKAPLPETEEEFQIAMILWMRRMVFYAGEVKSNEAPVSKRHLLRILYKIGEEAKSILETIEGEKP